MSIYQLPCWFKLVIDWLGGEGAEFHFIKLDYIVKEKLCKNIAEGQFPLLASIVGAVLVIFRKSSFTICLSIIWKLFILILLLKSVT